MWRESHRHSRWIQSCTVNLAKFTLILIPPWHIFGCIEMKYVRGVNRLCALGAWRRTISVHTMHCHVVRDPFSHLYLLFLHEFRISSGSLGFLLKVIFVSPNMFVCIPHVYMRVQTNTETAFEVYNSKSANWPPTEPWGLRVRVQQPLCRPASFSFRPYRYVYCELNKACET